MSAPRPAGRLPRGWRRGLATAITGASLLLATNAHAATITSVTTAFLAGNSTDNLVDTATTTRVRTRSLGVQASDATSFQTRYAMIVGTDTGNTASITENFTANYQITLGIQAPLGQVWQLLVDTSRVGALTVVNDGNGWASATLGAVTSAATGGALSGSLDLPAVGTTSNAGNAATRATSPNTPFSQLSAGILTGVGTGAVQTITLSFTWTASSASNRQGGSGPGDEAAVRMGFASTASSYTADDYPGVGARTQALDGHFVSATLIPEPHTALLLALGLAGLAWSSRRRS